MYYVSLNYWARCAGDAQLARAVCWPCDNVAQQNPNSDTIITIYLFGCLGVYWCILCILVYTGVYCVYWCILRTSCHLFRWLGWLGKLKEEEEEEGTLPMHWAFSVVPVYCAKVLKIAKCLVHFVAPPGILGRMPSWRLVKHSRDD